MKTQPKSTKVQSNLLTYIVAGIVILLVGVFAYKSIVARPQVALVGESQKACLTAVTRFTLSGLCAGNKAKMVTFACANGKASGIDGAVKCIDPVEAYNYAKEFCGKDCPVVSASPSSSPANCSQEAGACRTAQKICKTYTNGCEKAQICGTPFTACNVPAPSLPANCTQEAGSCRNAQKICKTYTNGCEKDAICGAPFTPCNTPKPSASSNSGYCSQEAGRCMGGGSCQSYKNGCEKSALCDVPFKTCGEPAPSITVTGSCLPMTGKCAGKTSTCATYTNDCERADRCSAPYRACPASQGDFCVTLFGRKFCLPTKPNQLIDY